MRASDVVLTNSAGVHAEPIADTVLAMVLHFARGLDWAVRAQAERRWEPEPLRWLGVSAALAAMTTADGVEARTGRPARRAELFNRLLGH